MESSIMAFRGLIYSRFRNESDFARELGWPRQKLNKITTGAKVPSVKELNAMANAMGVKVDSLIPFFLPGESPNGQQLDC